MYSIWEGTGARELLNHSLAQFACGYPKNNRANQTYGNAGHVLLNMTTIAKLQLSKFADHQLSGVMESYDKYGYSIQTRELDCAEKSCLY
jgi:hypothetical protein